MSETAARVDLIRKAAASSLSNCFAWIDDKVMLRVGRDPDNKGLSPVKIKDLARQWITRYDGEIVEKVEDRPEWVGRREFWYKIIIPVDPAEDFPRGLFVELELTDDDPEYPEVSLLNAHPAKEGPKITKGPFLP